MNRKLYSQTNIRLHQSTIIASDHDGPAIMADLKFIIPSKLYFKLSGHTEFVVDKGNWVHYWVRAPISKCQNRQMYVQVNLCQKPLFLHQLTHNMTTDCSLNYKYLVHVIETTKFTNSESPIFCLIAWSTVGRDTLQFINWNHETFSNSF